MTFLSSFAAEFSGKFKEVIDLSENFKAWLKPTYNDLEQFDAHRFLEKRGETLTVKDLRNTLHNINIEPKTRLSFIEYLLFKYNKSAAELFENKPNSELVAKLEAAVEQYKGVMEAKAAKENRIKELREIVAKGGKDSPRARVELRQLEMGDPAKEVTEEMSAIHARLAAKRALLSPEEHNLRLLEEEKRRLEELNREQVNEERRQRELGRNRLKEKAALWK
jgi:hypothetical protein